ncbi:hypothetical protein FSP39_014400 [Pinctada imbricata]|uniref:Uncharacterized protein n=1 Tax=Pinctada imbricata TaxID=66713 RepID=A0AA89BTN3_PINIB|nr:hypothetical protein FSP39_014400 [Pinctada imbricata]
MVEKEDGFELDFDICEPTVSAFAELFAEQEKMKGLLKCLEDEVTAFFREWPSSVYVSDLQTSFERMNLHALCQYMDLRSHSEYHLHICNSLCICKTLLTHVPRGINSFIDLGYCMFVFE